MQIELINTGTELMRGDVLNTDHQWLCRQLAGAGYTVARQVAVDDAAAHIQEAVREALGRADIVITSGGLGPTSDDLTRDAVAALLGRRLIEDASVRAQIDAWFAARNRPQPPATRLQAMVPEGAIVIPNTHGTAPGLRMRCRPGSSADSTVAADTWLIMLPGPPRELQPMFLEGVLPWLKAAFPPPGPTVCRILRSTGLGESVIQEMVGEPLSKLGGGGLEVGYCARPGEVDVRLTARGAAAEALVADAEAVVRGRLGDHVFGGGGEVLEQVVVRLLTDRWRTVAAAESCTGGRLSNRITDVPGASAVFVGGAVTYSNDLKQRMLGVRSETLAAHGAVSEATAREMAEGARARLGADYALATTGIAGPSGGTETKPVGTVFIALAGPDRTVVRHEWNRFDRETFKRVTTQQALDLLRRELLL